MTRSIWPWLVTGGAAAAIVYFATQDREAPGGDDGDAEARELSLRNKSLSYQPIGSSGPYPDWVRALRGRSGVYLIRERQRDGSNPVVYIGESHTDRLYQTLTRHFSTVRRQ